MDKKSRHNNMLFNTESLTEILYNFRLFDFLIFDLGVEFAFGADHTHTLRHTHAHTPSPLPKQQEEKQMVGNKN